VVPGMAYSAGVKINASGHDLAGQQEQAAPQLGGLCFRCIVFGSNLSPTICSFHGTCNDPPLHHTGLKLQPSGLLDFKESSRSA
jgi:hypothetical protein